MAGDRRQLVFCTVPPGDSEKDDARDASACETSGSDSEMWLCIVKGITAGDGRCLGWFPLIASFGVSGSGSGVVVAPVKLSTVVTDVEPCFWC